MRVTRQKTGKLPPRTVREDVVEDYESPPPSPSRKRPAEAMEEPLEVPEVEVVELVVPKKEVPAFQTFKSNKKLEGGLCLVRPLGGGKYEIINVEKVDQELFTSEETGRMVKADESRRMALNIDEQVWKTAQFKCTQAASSADKSIFRFTKLPLELRYRVYDFAIVGAKCLHHSWDTDPSPKTLGLALMQTSKQMYEEARPFLYKNNFQVNVVDKCLLPILPILRENLKEVTFKWYAFARKDRAAISFFETCKNLKIFNLVVTDWCSITFPYHYRRQYMYQDVHSIEKFSNCYGFDFLVDLRGMETVRVMNAEGNRKASAKQITPAEIKALEDFLNTILTKAKYVPPPKPVPVKKAIKPTKTKKVAKSKKSKSKRARWDDDSEYDG